MSKDSRRLAIVLFNLGGPDSLKSVRPFLKNLFSDPKILDVARPVRFFLSELISHTRSRKAQRIYKAIGGKSPILSETEKQAKALEKILSSDRDVKVFIAMRYWKPFAEETFREVVKFNPEQVILLPLYPQYSNVTSGSSLEEWQDICNRFGYSDYAGYAIKSFPEDPGFISAYAALTLPHLEKARERGRFQVLFSAHGLPEKVIKAGDVYQQQCERTALALALTLKLENLNTDEPLWLNTYQSKVGPLAWITPATDDVIRQAGSVGKSVVVVPISFVCEHSETLFELDQEYAGIARESGVPYYGRVSAVGNHPDFISGLASLINVKCASIS